MRSKAFFKSINLAKLTFLCEIVHFNLSLIEWRAVSNDLFFNHVADQQRDYWLHNIREDNEYIIFERQWVHNIRANN